MAASIPEDEESFRAGLAGEEIDVQLEEMERLADLVVNKA